MPLSPWSLQALALPAHVPGCLAARLPCLSDCLSCPSAAPQSRFLARLWICSAWGCSAHRQMHGAPRQQSEWRLPGAWSPA